MVDTQRERKVQGEYKTKIRQTKNKREMRENEKKQQEAPRQVENAMPLFSFAFFIVKLQF